MIRRKVELPKDDFSGDCKKDVKKLPTAQGWTMGSTGSVHKEVAGRRKGETRKFELGTNVSTGYIVTCGRLNEAWPQPGHGPWLSLRIANVPQAQ